MLKRKENNVAKRRTRDVKIKLSGSISFNSENNINSYTIFLKELETLCKRYYLNADVKYTER